MKMFPYGIFFILFVIENCNGLSKHPRLLVVSFDGFWPGYLDLYKNDTPNFKRLENISVRAPWMENVFITKTFPNHFSISTGLFEENHGIVANIFYDSVLNETFHLNDTEPKWWDTGAVPVWVENQLASPNRHSGGMMWPGTNALIKNQTSFYTVEYNASVDYKTKIDSVLEWFTHSVHPANCVFLYFDEPDITGHVYGPYSKQMKEAVKKIDDIVGYLMSEISKTHLNKKLNIILTSDHGMAEIKPDHAIDITQILNNSYTKYGSSPVWAIYPNPGKEEFVYQTFKTASEENDKIVIYKKEEIPERFHYKANRRIPPLLLIAKEGYDLYDEGSKPNFSHPYGNHGYDNKVASMHSLFIAFGPAFKKGAVITPFRSVDMYPLMCHILKLTPHPNNGSFFNVVAALHDPFGSHVMAVWLIVICTLLGLCILVGIIAAVVTSTNYPIRRLDGLQHMYRSKQTAMNTAAGDEENTYLLVPSATDEV